MAAPVNSNSFNDFRNNNSDNQLHFQEFTFDSADKQDLPPAYEDPDDATETADLLSGEEPVKKTASFWEFSYYQSLFDVDTAQVMNRIVWSMIPLPGRATYLHRCIKPTPDLYGPFWICATLVFTIAIGGNMADYLHTAGKQRDIWRYDFHKVSLAATTIYTYSSLVPIALWGLLWSRRSSANYSLFDLICLYGYSMSIYVPVSVLCIVQIWWLQWTLVIVGAILSGTVLLLTLWPAVKDDPKKISFGVLLVVITLHILLAVGFLAYFFQPNSNGSIIIKPTTATTLSHITATTKNIPTKLISVESLKNVVNATISNLTLASKNLTV